MKTKTLIIKEGNKCKINAGEYGMVIDGPAIVTIIKAVPIADESEGTADESYQGYKIPPLGVYEPQTPVKG